MWAFISNSALLMVSDLETEKSTEFSNQFRQWLSANEMMKKRQLSSTVAEHDKTVGSQPNMA